MMTETLEPGESPADCALRGLREEMGIEAALVTAYIGSTVTAVSDHRGVWSKTTLWLSVDVPAVVLPQSSRDGDLLAVWLPDLQSADHDAVRWPDAAMLHP